MVHRKKNLQSKVFASLVVLGFVLLLLTPERASGTTLGDLAAQMQPDTWAELNTTGLDGGLLISDTNSGSYIIQYMDKATWDPITRQVLFIGGPHTGMPKFIVYSESSNIWRREPDAYWWRDIHGYQHNAINVAAGEFYHRPYDTTRVYKYKIATKTWSDLPPIPMESKQVAGALEYFPERNGLLFIDGDWGAFFFDMNSNTWNMIANTSNVVDTTLPTLPMGPYHNFAVYSPIHKVIVFGGGNGSSDVYKFDAAGKLTTMKDAPIGLGIAQTIFTVDPVTGNFLIFTKGKSVYEYNPADDKWTSLSISTPPFFDVGADDPIFGTIAVPISSHGVIMFVNFDFAGSKVYLYKHSPTPPGDTTPPGAPTGVKVN